MKMRAVAIAVLFCLIQGSALHAQSPFYQGKTIRMVVGYLAGDGYDIWARIVAAHLEKQIPGNPNIVVQNMPGAGSAIAANYIYAVAKPDGLTLGATSGGLYLNQLAGHKEIQFDWGNFTWIGSAEKTSWLFYMRSDAPYKTLEDVRKASEPPKCSATGTGTSGHFVPRLLEETIGTKFNLVMGYRGGAEQDLALERGEVQCRALSIPTFFAREPFHTWRKTGLVRVLMQTGRTRDARLPDVPTIYELMEQYKASESSRRLATVVLASGALGRPYIAPPRLPPEHTKTLREAFTKAINDPELRAEAKKKKLDADPSTGADLEVIAKEAVSQPAEVIERMRKLLGK
ncbi:MAG: tripartite tricarboxylate transporter substrate binding protein [Deltaproteobacteria bacterium]|nr:tripartite tricarboxylate transporter substrate binding protein [Deltaproteobacteria bacterium]